MDCISAFLDLTQDQVTYGERDRSLDIIILLTHFGYRIWVVLKITRENVCLKFGNIENGLSKIRITGRDWKVLFQLI